MNIKSDDRFVKMGGGKGALKKQKWHIMCIQYERLEHNIVIIRCVTISTSVVG